jgi:hypothetical protein
MPSVYPFYLWFVQLHGHGGFQPIAILSAGRLEARTNWARLVGDFVFRQAQSDVWMPAPAHVEAFADDGLFYAFIVLVLIGVGIRLAGAIREGGRNSTLDRAFLLSACCTIYMTTQFDLSEALYSSWGILWSLSVYGLLKFSTRAPRAGLARVSVAPR